jgi:hypothetical protein
MSNRWFEITESDNRVVNCILWDGVVEYFPPSGLYLMQEGEVPDMQVGWKKIDGVWTAPPKVNKEEEE